MLVQSNVRTEDDLALSAISIIKQQCNRKISTYYKYFVVLSIIIYLDRFV